MMSRQLKIDIFNIKAPIIEEEQSKLMKRKRDNNVEVVKGFAKIIGSEKVVFEEKKEVIKCIKF